MTNMAAKPNQQSYDTIVVVTQKGLMKRRNRVEVWNILVRKCPIDKMQILWRKLKIGNSILHYICHLSAPNWSESN